MNEHAYFWLPFADRLLLTIAWQSTVCLALGLLVGFVLRRRASRAHLAVTLATVAAIFAPLLTTAVRRMEWGLLPPPPAAVSVTSDLEVAPPTAPRESATSGPIELPIDQETDSVTEPIASSPPSSEADGQVAIVEPPRIAEKVEPSSTGWTALFSRSLPLAIAGLWFTSSLLLTIRLIASLFAAHRIARETRAEQDPRLLAALREAVEVLSLPFVPDLRVSGFARCPMIWCWGPRPVVLLPESADARAPIFWRSVFCHELAHLVRRDHWSALWAEIVVIVLPWQPLSWRSRRRLAYLREQACDDWVLAAGGTATDYAESLMHFVPQASATHVLAAVSSREALKSRLEHLLAGARVAPKIGRNWIILATLFTLVAVTGVAIAQPRAKTQLSKVTASQTERASSSSKQTSPSTTSSPTAGHASGLAGLVLNEHGKPISGAHVSAIATSLANESGGALQDRHKILGEATSDAAGTFHIAISGVSSKSHRMPVLMAGAEGYALAVQPFDLDGAQDGAQVGANFHLTQESVVRGRFVDLQGQPVANVAARVAQIGVAPGIFLPDTAYMDRDVWLAAAWPKSVISNKEGRFAIRGVGANQGIYLGIDGTDRLAQQVVSLNAHRREGLQSAVTLKPGDEAVVPLSPATIVEGVIRFADTKQPAPHARLTVYATQQPPYGSFVGIAGQADAQGRYRITPYPGTYFQVTAYPPVGTPYLIRQSAGEVKPTEPQAHIDVELPRGVLVRGKVIEAAGNVPVANASIQYVPANRTRARAKEGVMTGWPGIALANSRGEFTIAVLPGVGHLLVHGPTADYVYQEIGDRELASGSPGGRRNYAHAISRIDPPNESAPPIELTIRLKRGTVLSGRLQTPEGRPAEEVLMINRLQINPTSPTWRGHATEIVRGGQFALSGCDPGLEQTVYFLDQEHRWGATARLTAERARAEPVTVRLAPCGSAKVRFVDSKGQPIAELDGGLHLVVTPGASPFGLSARERGQLAADVDFAANIDRKNQTPSSLAGLDGVATYRALIPGGTYQLIGGRDGKLSVLKEFSAVAGNTLDLGDVVADRPRQR